MEVQFEPALQAKLDEIARRSGSAAANLVHDAVAGYVDGLAETRRMLGRNSFRYPRIDSVSHWGHRRNDLTNRPLRFILVRNYLIAYAAVLRAQR